MTQKQLITANNAELEKHKQDILSLPMADDVKNGKYVWKKYKIIPPVTVSNPTFIMNKASGQASFTIVQASFDVMKIENWKDFFHNFENTSESRRFNTLAPNPTLIYNSLNDNYTLTNFTPKNTSEGEFKIQKVDYMEFSSLFTYQGTKNLISSKKEILSYVISDESTAYPDGGEKDGFWWERVKEGLPITQMGFTKFTYGEFVLSTDSALDFKLTHNLGVKPKKVRIYTEDSLKGATDAIREVALMNRYTSYSGDGREYYFESGVIQSYSYPDQEGFSNFDTVVYPEYVTESIITFKTESYYLLARGKKYYWYALA